MRMNEETYFRLMNLLPRLSAITDKRRLKVLSDIDRVLAADGLSWDDIAEALMSPSGVTPSKTILDMIDAVAKAELVMTENAVQFLSQLREQASQEPAVELSPKQNHWIRGLFERAEKKLSPPRKADKPEPQSVVQSNNVLAFPQTKVSA
jgi:hypothetical protein